MIIQTSPLTNLQLEILKLFFFELSEVELLEIKRLLVKHFATRISQRAQEIWDNKGLTVQDMENWLNDENQ